MSGHAHCPMKAAIHLVRGCCPSRFSLIASMRHFKLYPDRTLPKNETVYFSLGFLMGTSATSTKIQLIRWRVCKQCRNGVK